MNIDKNTVLIIIFTLVDEIMKAPQLTTQLKRPGQEPKLSDAEVITMALYQELIGGNREDHFFRLHGEELRSFFPDLNERSRYNRRKRDLGQMFALVRTALGITLGIPWAKTAITDSALVPVVGYKRDKSQTDFTEASYGYCSGKALKYFGFKLHSLVTLGGSIIDY